MKAQLRSMETIIIVIVITILFVMGYAIFQNVNTAQLEKKDQMFSEARQARLNNIIIGMDEFKCSTLSIEEIACVDIIKAESFSSLSDTSIYDDVLGNTVINLAIVLPDQSIIEIYDRSLTEFTRRNTVFNPVNAYNPVTGKMSFAILEITFYEK